MVVLMTTSSAAFAQEASLKAVGSDVTYSTDADDTGVLRTGFNLDWHYAGPEHYLGIRLERLRYTPSGGASDADTRVYLRLADQLDDWKYQAALGTDGKTVVGSASIHNEQPFRQEYFVERDKIETPIGVSRGLYYTFGGAAFDVPLGRSTQATILSGIQEFTGDNVRLHLRGNLIQTVKSDWGLSAQLRTRYFYNTVPGEFDYFSPRWYGEVVPVLQVRRYIRGWRLVAAGGLGAQRNSGSRWRSSRYLNLRATRSLATAGWGVSAEATYTSTPITRAGDYHYLRASLGLTRVF
jgi:hypothetical protein